MAGQCQLYIAVETQRKRGVSVISEAPSYLVIIGEKLFMTTERYQRGLDRMTELVAGNSANTFDHAKLLESYKTLDPDLSDYIVSFAFGDIYSRKSLTQQEQAMVTISTLVALGTEPQLKVHINIGFKVGLSKEKIVGSLIHCIPYVGFPRVLNALALLKEVIEERDLTPQSAGG